MLWRRRRRLVVGALHPPAGSSRRSRVGVCVGGQLPLVSSVFSPVQQNGPQLPLGGGGGLLASYQLPVCCSSGQDADALAGLYSSSTLCLDADHHLRHLFYDLDTPPSLPHRTRQFCDG